MHWRLKRRVARRMSVPYVLNRPTFFKVRAILLLRHRLYLACTCLSFWWTSSLRYHRLKSTRQHIPNPWRIWDYFQSNKRSQMRRPTSFRHIRSSQTRHCIIYLWSFIDLLKTLRIAKEHLSTLLRLRNYWKRINWHLLGDMGCKCGFVKQRSESGPSKILTFFQYIADLYLTITFQVPVQSLPQ